MFHRNAALQASQLSEQDIIDQLNAFENAKILSTEGYSKDMETKAYRLEDIIRVPRKGNKVDLYILNQGERLGAGSHSEIVKAYPLSIENNIVKIHNEKPVAVKHIHPIHESATEDDKVDREKVIEGLQHESKTFKTLGKPLGDHVAGKNGDYLVMPLVGGEKLATGTTRSAVLQNASPTQRAEILYQLSGQVKQMHDKKIMHGDLHPENIMVKLEEDNGDKINIQLIDFDQSRKISSKRNLNHSETVRMADQIAPPEISKKQVGAPSDIYALGLNFLFILGHPNPYAPVKNDAALKIAAKNEFMETPGYNASMEEFKNSDEYKTLPSDVAKDTAVRLKRMELVNNNKGLYSEENLNRVYQKQKPVLEIGELTSIPLEVDGIKLREEVEKFLKKNAERQPER